jgi:hypothetical protein
LRLYEAVYDRRQDECRPLIVVILRPEPHVDPMLPRGR